MKNLLQQHGYHADCHQKDPISTSSSSSSIFNMVYSESENINQNTCMTSSKLCSDDALEQKLLQRKQCKRIKLLEQKNNNTLSVSENSFSSSFSSLNSHTTAINDEDCSLSAKYMTLFKSVLKSSNRMNESEYATRLNDFKQSMQEYKQTILSNQKTVQNNQSDQPVEVLFTQLSRIFIPLETPGLLQDAICFLLPEHRKRYAELCHNLTGLPIIQQDLKGDKYENNTNQMPQNSAVSSKQSTKPTEKSLENLMKCCKCSANPAEVPLISCCKHIACFKCWRYIIEQGDRQCPSCRKLLRRRDLSRLTQKTDTN
ncbi:unnamed protein product [Heterobilharzia americana]|nr:unnamed protein product [Heterobilharzia americana]